MNDSSSIQGSTTSSSSDVTTLTTASSWCSIPASSRLRVVRLVRPHSRRILVSPSNNPSFGFAVRGGKEFGTGFFVSNVERYNEAEQKGLKVGDQILRVNGYRVDDSVHKELIQFITSQDRLTLKVRGVGLIPIKNKENDSLTWHAVRTNSCTSASSLCTEDSFRSLLNHPRSSNPRSKDVHIILNVAPRTKLGLGICKGPEWKPGIFIQFTKEKSVAREAGLRPGDQILCVNSIDFSDVLFREAVAVMKSATKLDMIVRTAAGSDLFPGESSGYNSSASSVTGDQSPCWTDISAKRLTVVREEPHMIGGNEYVSVDYQKIKRKPSSGNEKLKLAATSNDQGGTLKEINKTIIKLSENGTSINNTYIENPRKILLPETRIATSDHVGSANDDNNGNYQLPIPPPPPPSLKNVEPSNLVSADGDSTQKVADICFVSRQSETKTVTVEVHRSNSNEKKSLQQLRFVAPDRKERHSPKIGTKEQKECDAKEISGEGATGSTLCSAIAQELKKRKDKLHNTAGHQKKLSAVQENRNNIYESSAGIGFSENLSTAPSSSTNKKFCNAAKSNRNINGSEHNGDDQHSALMDEFKRAHRRMFKNGFQENDRKITIKKLRPLITIRSRHSDVFIALHDIYIVERQDVLKKTTVMDYRDDQQSDSSNLTNIRKLQPIYSNGIDNITNLKSPPPPPPLEFMGSKPVSLESNKLMETPSEQNPKASKNELSTLVEMRKAPDSPVPDYEYDQVHGTIPKSIQSKRKTNTDTQSIGNTQRSTQSVNVATTSGNRRTMRLGTVTIGEYTTPGNVQNQYKEPAKFDFLTTKKMNNEKDVQHRQPTMLHSELQNTLSRSNLKNRTTNNASEHLEIMEHQSHCHLVGGDTKKTLIINGVGMEDQVEKEPEYTNIEKLTRMLQCKQNLNETTSPMRPISYQLTPTRKSVEGNVSNMRNDYSTGNGILKNGNGSKTNRNSLSKSTEKSISFGN